MVGGATLLFAPTVFARLLPLLFLAACPLSMLLMSGAMMRGKHSAAVQAGATAEGAYCCPMHHEVTRENAGSCPECGMRLLASTNAKAPEANDEVKNLRAENESLRAELASSHRGETPETGA